MLTSGYCLDQSRILNYLGGGGFGDVYKAEPVSGGSPYAIKVFRPTGNLSNDTKEEKRFREENRILSVLSPHKNIIRQLSDIINTSHLYYSMQLADINLEDYVNINYSSLDFSAKKEIFLGVCEGISHAHSKNIVHRDLWVKNVLLEYEQSSAIPKVSDFGRAKNFSSQDISNFPLEDWGQRRVRPPEYYFQLWNQADHSNYLLGDIYALGLLLYFILQEVPDTFVGVMLSKLSTFLTQNNINIDTIDIHERVNAYNQWLAYMNPTTPHSHLRVNLADKTREDAINLLIKDMTDFDYRTRVPGVKEVISRVILIN